MFFKRANPNLDLMQHLLSKLSDKNLSQQYLRRIELAREILFEYHDNRLFGNHVQIEFKNRDLQDVLKDIEKYLVVVGPSPLTHLRFKIGLSIASLAPGITSIALLMAFKNTFYALININHWLAFFTIMLPLIAISVVVMSFGIIGMSVNDENMTRWELNKQEFLSLTDVTPETQISGTNNIVHQE